MKKHTLLLVVSLFALLLFGCNANKTKTLSNNAHQQVNNTRAFPTASREVVCHNCRAKFKLTANLQKSSNGHTYIECPICHHDYTKSNQE